MEKTMENLKNYLRSCGTSPAPSAEESEALLAAYPWFTVARAVRERVSGAEESVQKVLRTARAVSSLWYKSVDAQALAEVTEDEIIDSFLRLDDYKIVADEAFDAEEIRTGADLDDEDDLVSEELAEVYIAQGMKAKAIEIYRKLSLLNTEKSIYFAKKIEKLSNNN